MHLACPTPATLPKQVAVLSHASSPNQKAWVDKQKCDDYLKTERPPRKNALVINKQPAEGKRASAPGHQGTGSLQLCRMICLPPLPLPRHPLRTHQFGLPTRGSTLQEFPSRSQWKGSLSTAQNALQRPLPFLFKFLKACIKPTNIQDSQPVSQISTTCEG